MKASEDRNARRARRRLPETCRHARAALVAEAAGDRGRPEWCDAHLAECHGCAAYASRLLAAGAALRADRPGLPEGVAAEAPPAWRRERLALGLALACVVVLLAAVLVGRRPASNLGPSGSEDPHHPRVAAADASSRSAARPSDSGPAGAGQATTTLQPEAGAPKVALKVPDEPPKARQTVSSPHRSSKARPRHGRPSRPRARPAPAQPAGDEQLRAPEPEGTEVAPQPPMPEREPRIILIWQTADGRVVAREEVRGDGGVVLDVPRRIVVGSVEQTAGGTVTEVLEAETAVVVAYWKDEVICAEAQGGG